MRAKVPCCLEQRRCGRVVYHSTGLVDDETRNGDDKEKGKGKGKEKGKVAFPPGWMRWGFRTHCYCSKFTKVFHWWYGGLRRLWGPLIRQGTQGTKKLSGLCGLRASTTTTARRRLRRYEGTKRAVRYCGRSLSPQAATTVPS